MNERWRVGSFLARGAMLVFASFAPVHAQAAWTAQPGLTSRAEFAAVYDEARAHTFLFGGNDGLLRNDCWTWDGVNWTEVTPATRPSPRRAHSMVYDSLRQRVLLYGGSVDVFVSNETWSWDGTNWTLLTPAQSPGFLQGQSMAYDAVRDRVVLWTGTSSGSFGSIWEFDGVTWAQVPTVPTSWPLWVPPAALAYDPVTATVALHRGSGSQGGMWRWNGTSWTQQTINPAPPLQLSRMVFDTAQQRLLLVAGFPQGATTPPTVYAWSGTAWQAAAFDGPYFVNHDVAYDSARQCVVLVGGARVNSGSDSSVWEWSTQWTRKTWAPPGARAGHTVAADVADDRVVLFGGQWPLSSGDTWERVQGRWEMTIQMPSPTFPPTHPGALRRCRIVHDEARDEFLLLAGCCTVEFPFWRLVGNQWQAITGTMPPGREDPAVAYDSKRGRVVMFGGDPFTSGTGSDDMWVWNGTSWTELQPVHRPQPRSNAGMAYDPLRDRMVLVGGMLLGGSATDTWEFDGVDWHQIPVATLPVSVQPRLVYDVSRQAIVGYMAPPSGTDGETWQWNGVAWSRIAIATPLPALGEPALVSSAEDVQLIGGRWTNGESSTIWSLRTPNRAGLWPFGSGSASSVGPLVLRGTGQWPWIGETCRLAFGAVPPIALPGMWFGGQQWDPPFDLAVFGWPGRQVLVSLDGPLPAVNDGSGGAIADIVVPYDATFLGVSIYCQGFVFEPLTGELTASNGLGLTFGAR